MREAKADLFFHQNISTFLSSIIFSKDKIKNLKCAFSEEILFRSGSIFDINLCLRGISNIEDYIKPSRK